MSKLSPTSFALLALLSIQPWSAYELTRYMRESTLRAIWPRAASHIYSEVKRLEKAGLATSEVARQGNRQRSIYRATIQGEEALGEWIAEQSRRFTYESEAMLKVAYAEHGELDDLRRTIADVRSEALQDLSIMGGIFEGIIASGERGRLPQRRAYNALVSRFTLEMVEARLRWVEHADAYLANWDDVTTSTEKENQGGRSYAESLEHIRALLAKRETEPS